MQILDINRAVNLNENVDYIITLDDGRVIKIETMVYGEKWWLHCEDFETIEEFKSFLHDVLLQSNLFYDRLRFILFERDKLVVSAKTAFLYTVYAMFWDSDKHAG